MKIFIDIALAYLMMMKNEKLSKFHAKIGGLSCSFCVESIKKAIIKIEGVKDVSVSLSHEEILVIYDPAKVSEAELEKTLTDLGYNVRDPRKVKALEEQRRELQTARKYLLLSAILAFISLSLMVLMWFGIKHYAFKPIMFLLAIATMFGPGFHIKKKAYSSLRRGILNQHVLLEFGAFAGLTGGILGFLLANFPVADFFAVSVFLTAYHILSEWSSLLVRTKASQAVQKLLDLQPKTAVVVINGKEVVKNVNELKPGEILRVKPGERIAADGIVVGGFSYVDESIVTGESVPVEKRKGDRTIGGSINLSGSFDLKITETGEDSFLHQVIKHVEEARALKPSILIIVDRVLKYYVPGVIAFAVFAFMFWTIISYFIFGSMNINRAIFASLSVLVMGYPCALGMAMPLALIRGSEKAAEKGILMRSGEAFQVFPYIKRIVFDKTGTLTKGELEVTDFINYHDRKENVLFFLASSEKLSEHPIAEAILDYAGRQQIKYEDPEEFDSFPGLGVKAKFKKKSVIVGKLSFLIDNGIDIDKIKQKQAEKLEEEGKTVIGMAIDKSLVAIVALADTVKEDAKKTVMELEKRGIKPIMITGDNAATASYIAEELGINEFYAGVLPEEKAGIIRKLQRTGVKLAMVGDGINDAPALMQADVGMAIGSGVDIAIESADIIIIGKQISKIIDAYEIAKESYSKTEQNLILAFLFNGIGIPLATTGLLHPVFAMLAMVASVSTVLLNSFGIKNMIYKKRALASKERAFHAFVPGMSCENCKRSILAMLRGEKGVINPQVTISSKTVSFTYMPKTCNIRKIEDELRKRYGEIYIIGR